MTTAPATGEAEQPDLLDTYAEQMTGVPVLGYLLLYSVAGGEITAEQAENWFDELDLDTAMLPPAPRPVDAFEKVTGRSGVRLVYSLDDPLGEQDKQERYRERKNRIRRKDREEGAFDRVATVMLRPVRRDTKQIVRHIVREIRDESNTKLSYETHLGEAIFRRDADPHADATAGALHLDPDNTAIAALPASEQDVVRELFAELRKQYTWSCTYLGSDRLRGTIRRYVEALGAIKVRPSGGVYFASAEHEQVLGRIREFVGRLGEHSHFSRVPLLDQSEMREMIVEAFTTETATDLDKLAADIAAQQAEMTAGRGGPAALHQLHARFRHLKENAGKYSTLLSTSLDDTDAALHLVERQLASLMVAGDREDREE